MTPEEIVAIAEELNFDIDYTPEGEMVLFTGVIDENKREVPAADVEAADEFEDEDELEDIFDPYA